MLMGLVGVFRSFVMLKERLRDVIMLDEEEFALDYDWSSAILYSRIDVDFL
jgi:hypothetical protein